MGKLKPIGSEKLQGIDKINRMIEISRYKENTPTPINEDKSLEYKITLSDGNNYQIVKEKNGYVIKRSLNESESDYLEPMKNRKYYSSYSQAMKRLNLITKELNTLHGKNENTSLFTEGEEEGKKKYFLKVKTNEQAPPPAPAPAPEPQPVSEPSTEVQPSDEIPMPPPEADEEMPTDDTELGTSDETDTEEVTFKTIQKLTGKLGQKIREFSSKEENKMSSNDIKYVVNSILSALNLNDLETEDKEEIMSKFEGGEDMTSDEEMMDVSDDMGTEEMMPEPPPSPEGEMGESMSHYNKINKKFPELKHHESSRMEEMIEGIFSESKVENVLKKYFKLDESEKKSTEKNIVTKIKNISESVSQEVASRKFLKENPKAKLLGKTPSKNLVFESNNKKFVISPKGQIK